MRQRRAAWLLGSLSAVIVWSCAGQTDDNEAGGDTAAPTAGGSIFNASGGTTALGPTTANAGSGNVTRLTANGACQIIPDEGCTGEAMESEKQELDIYVMFDQSGSMCNCVSPLNLSNPKCPDTRCTKTRLDAVREALDLFMKDPQSAGIGIGIGYFGYMPYGETSCNSAQYANAAVTVADLPGQASAVMGSLMSIGPQGETPTGAAIEGACTYAQNVAMMRGRKVVILLLTDGRPEAPITCSGTNISCCPTLADAEEKARACNGGANPIPLYVLGVGPMTGNMDGIALAGGTKQAHIVSQDGDVTGLVNALNDIRADAKLPCDYQPGPAPGQTSIDYTKEFVTIKYADAKCNGTAFKQVTSVGACTDGGGWYLDESTDPPTIRLCPTSCNQVSQGGKLLLTVSCRQTQVLL